MNETGIMACGDKGEDKFEKYDKIPIAVENLELNNFSRVAGERCSDFVAKRSMISSNPSPSFIEETNPFLKEITTKVTMGFFQTEHEKLPEIDKSLFEVEEPELINIFTKSSQLKNTRPCMRNPFNDDFVSNPRGILRKSTNPFEKTLNDINLCTDECEDTRIDKLDSSEWHKLDKIFQKAMSSKISLK